METEPFKQKAVKSSTKIDFRPKNVICKAEGKIPNELIYFFSIVFFDKIFLLKIENFSVILPPNARFQALIWKIYEKFSLLSKYFCIFFCFLNNFRLLDNLNANFLKWLIIQGFASTEEFVHPIKTDSLTWGGFIQPKNHAQINDFKRTCSFTKIYFNLTFMAIFQPPSASWLISNFAVIYPNRKAVSVKIFE